MRKAILAAMLLVIPAGAAFADGVNKPAATTPPPPPLQVPQQGAVHHGSNSILLVHFLGHPVHQRIFNISIHQRIYKTKPCDKGLVVVSFFKKSEAVS